MLSLRKRALPAATKVNVLSPEILRFAEDEGFHLLEVNINTCVKSECVLDMPGSEAVAGKQNVYVGTWEDQNVSDKTCKNLKKRRARNADLVVGLTRSRGVNRVTSIESKKEKTLEGVNNLMQREGYCCA